MQFEVKGKGNMNVQTMGGQRGREGANTDNIFCLSWLSKPSQVWEVCESLDASAAESNPLSKHSHM